MNRLFSLGVLLIFAACNTQPKTEAVKVESVKLETATAVPCGITGSPSCGGCPEAKGTKTLVVSVDSVQKNPEKYFDKTIALQGRVIHTCKETGKKMFLAGKDDQNLIRVNAGDNISRFDESLQGEIVIAKGVLTPINDVVDEKGKDGKTTCVTEGKAKQYVLACTEFEVTKN
ncbi:MAG: hypothetical protein NTY07_21315 [Bacteroidia bacterium]|nr:hypothetical protein [Bacteroidia bacterium]